jgi:hypothetical protein
MSQNRIVSSRLFMAGANCSFNCGSRTCRADADALLLLLLLLPALLRLHCC